MIVQRALSGATLPYNSSGIQGSFCYLSRSNRTFADSPRICSPVSIPPHSGEPMKLPLFLLAAAAATLAAAPAQAQLDPTVKTQLDSAAVLMRNNGHTLKQAPAGGSLAAGAEDRVELRLAGGSSYIIVGSCDSDCSDLDMVLTDSQGAEVDSDLELDDVPMVVVEVPANTTYTLTVKMATCGTATCNYGYAVFGT